MKVSIEQRAAALYKKQIALAGGPEGDISCIVAAMNDLVSDVFEEQNLLHGGHGANAKLRDLYVMQLAAGIMSGPTAGNFTPKEVIEKAEELADIAIERRNKLKL